MPQIYLDGYSPAPTEGDTFLPGAAYNYTVDAAARCASETGLDWARGHSIPFHYITLHCITLYYITHCITHCITHYITRASTGRAADERALFFDTPVQRMTACRHGCPVDDGVVVTAGSR